MYLKQTRNQLVYKTFVLFANKRRNIIGDKYFNIIQLKKVIIGQA